MTRGARRRGEPDVAPSSGLCQIDDTAREQEARVMGNYLAVDHVTAAFAARLDRAWANAQPPVGTRTQVTVGVPKAAPGDQPTINVHLFQVVRNEALTANELPTREAGRVMTLPVAAVDLSYLVSFHGDRLTERLLGIAEVDLHSRPYLSREDLAAVPAELRDASGLLRENRAINLSPLSLSLDELTRLWATMPSGAYAISLTWLATAVLLEPSDLPAVPGPPVRQVTLGVGPAPAPRIEGVRAVSPNHPIVAGASLLVTGQHLGGQDAALFIDDTETLANATSGGLQVALPASTTPGIHYLSASRRTAVLGEARLIAAPTSVPFVVVPEVRRASAETTVDDAVHVTTVHVELAAPVEPAQQITVMLLPPADGELPSARLTGTTVPPDQPASTLAAVGRGLPPGLYLVRVGVDQALSPLASSIPGGVYDGPSVIVP